MKIIILDSTKSSFEKQLYVRLGAKSRSYFANCFFYMVGQKKYKLP
jgi:hypothetical protein